jgi:hypothetical protein
MFGKTWSTWNWLTMVDPSSWSNNKGSENLSSGLIQPGAATLPANMTKPNVSLQPFFAKNNNFTHHDHHHHHDHNPALLLLKSSSSSDTEMAITAPTTATANMLHGTTTTSGGTLFVPNSVVCT